MKIICKYLAIGAIAILAATACQKTTTEKEAAGTENLPAADQKLKTDLTIANDSLQKNWQRMMESDNLKMASVKRLLDEISYTPKFNAIRQRQLLQLHKKTKALKFDMEGMKNSEAIDKYDAAQDTLINSTLDLAAATPDAEKFTLINDLASDIQHEHNQTIIFRIRHDEYARNRNQLLEQNQNKLKALGEPFASMTKVPLFSISGV